MLDQLRQRLPPPTTYEPVQFPLVHVGRDRFKFDNSSTTFDIASAGLNYIIYRLYGYNQTEQYIDKKKARHLFIWNERKFCEYVSFSARKMQSLNFKEAAREYFIAAFNGGDLWGLMTAYNPVAHRDVLDMIEQAGLGDKVIPYLGTPTPDEMTVYLNNGKELADFGGYYGMAISNGETGHVALSYQAYVKARNYLYMWPLQSTNRHLSRIGDTQEALQTALDECHNLDIINLCRTTPTSTLKLTTKNDKLQAILDTTSGTVDRLIADLTPLTDGYGLKTDTTKLLDQIFKQLTK